MSSNTIKIDIITKFKSIYPIIDTEGQLILSQIFSVDSSEIDKIKTMTYKIINHCKPRNANDKSIIASILKLFAPQNQFIKPNNYNIKYQPKISTNEIKEEYEDDHSNDSEYENDYSTDNEYEEKQQNNEITRIVKYTNEFDQIPLTDKIAFQLTPDEYNIFSSLPFDTVTEIENFAKDDKIVMTSSGLYILPKTNISLKSKFETYTLSKEMVIEECGKLDYNCLFKKLLEYDLRSLI